MKKYRLLVTFFLLIPFLYGKDSSEYVNLGWTLIGEKKFEQAIEVADECIREYSSEADQLANTLQDFPYQQDLDKYKVMNDVGVCYFIKAEAYKRWGKSQEAIQVIEEMVKKYPFAQGWDPRGWYWKVKEKGLRMLEQLSPFHPLIEKELKDETKITWVKLYQEGEFPVDYQKYGKFHNVGTENYYYEIGDIEGLMNASGEGVLPNTTSFRFSPRFVEIKRQLFNIKHWDIINSRDLETAFYKWNICDEPEGVKQFYIGDILERSGLIKQAIKAYYALIVLYPKTVAWTYWNTPWYPAKAAVYRIKYLLETHPELGYELKDAYVTVLNDSDNDISNDIFIVNPGKFVKKSFWYKFCFSAPKRRDLGKVVEIRGEGDIQLLKYSSGDWQLKVKNKPFILRAITYSPTRVGESPDEGTLANWMEQDLNNNGLIDGPFESWVDENWNNVQDPQEKVVGDFYLLKDMGVNAIRLYHQPYKPNKELLRKLYNDYGIYVLLGDFLGKYTLGSQASWQEGTDYDNPQHKKNMLESIKNMVEEFKDEEFVLMWILGNENVYGLGCNANTKPRSFFRFANEAAKLIKSLDPLKRPVMIVSGDTLYLDIFAEECPDIDIFGTNSYRGKYGFLGLFDDVKRIANKPVVITEYGAPSYAKGYTKEEAEKFQAEYHRGCWMDIYNNSWGLGNGNSLGGIVFEWLDEWWKAYDPLYHDIKGLFAGPFLDGYMHEEWLGICGQGDGRNSPYLRQLRKVYYTYKELWQKY